MFIRGWISGTGWPSDPGIPGKVPWNALCVCVVGSQSTTSSLAQSVTRLPGLDGLLIELLRRHAAAAAAADIWNLCTIQLHHVYRGMRWRRVNWWMLQPMITRSYRLPTGASTHCVAVYSFLPATINFNRHNTHLTPFVSRIRANMPTNYHI